MKLGIYVLRRLLFAIPVLIGVTILTFGISWIANEGHLERAYLTEKMTEDQKERIIDQYGFRDPWYLQYFRYLNRLLEGDLGFSKVAQDRQIVDVLKEFFPATIELTLAAMVIAVIVGVALGTLTAVRKDSPVDHATRFLALAGVSVPIFWLGLILKFALATPYPEDLFAGGGAVLRAIFLLLVFGVLVLFGLVIGDSLRGLSLERRAILVRAGFQGGTALLLLLLGLLLAMVGHPLAWAWPPLAAGLVAVVLLAGAAWSLQPTRPQVAAVLAGAVTPAVVVAVLFALGWGFLAWVAFAIIAIAYAVALSLRVAGRRHLPRAAWWTVLGAVVVASAATGVSSLGVPLIHELFGVIPELPLTGRFSNELVIVEGAHDSLTDGPTRILLIDTALAGDWVAFRDVARHLVLPGITLGYASLAVIARMMRASMLEVLSLDFVRTARAKGLTEGEVIRLHARRNALIPIATVVGLTFGGLLSGAVLTETIFAWPGLGRWSTQAIGAADTNSIMAFTLFVTVIYLTANFIVDIAYSIIDPRVRLG